RLNRWCQTPTGENLTWMALPLRRRTPSLVPTSPPTHLSPVTPVSLFLPTRPPSTTPLPNQSYPVSPSPPCSSSSQPPRQHRPIPLSVIMRLQNPYWASSALHPRALGTERDMGLYRHAPQTQPQTQPLAQPQTHELRQPAYHGEVLKPGDVDIELERLDPIHQSPMAPDPALPEKGRETERGGGGEPQAVAPRPLSPSRLQPVVAAESPDVPDMEELLRIRSEIPRALKRRGSVTPNSNLDPNPEPGSPPNCFTVVLLIARFYLFSIYLQPPRLITNSLIVSELIQLVEGKVKVLSCGTLPSSQGYNSILRRASRERGDSGQRARLSPLVLLLDGSLVGELDTVQRAVQEMNDPSQPNDEGITALHNAICGGHYSVVDFLVRIGANVSAPDSHGWTPLHCAASCNDLPLCQFLVRNGAAVMAVTESDDATASQKCDPYAMGFEECESFLKGVEEAMGVENSGVLYALWEYPAQEADELGFREGDMVTILQKPDGVDWWWASLCGREGFIPNNYFGLFPKVRPKSLC
ncbi:unnamed protein product, partial [Oncorhynchus mykiss]